MGACNYSLSVEAGVLWERGSTYLEGSGAGNRGRPSPVHTWQLLHPPLAVNPSMRNLLMVKLQ